MVVATEERRRHFGEYLRCSVSAVPDAEVAELQVEHRGEVFEDCWRNIDSRADDTKKGNSKREQVGGGKREEIRDFSRQSRRRLQKLFASIPRRGYSPDRLLFLSLTYGAEYPEDPARWKADLDAWRKRVERFCGEITAIWRLELQSRGAPHFHVLIFARDELVPELSQEEQKFEFGELLLRSWHELVAPGDHNHLVHGLDVRQARSWRGAMYYLSKYVAKTETIKTQGRIGRVWGCWRKDQLGIVWRSWNLSYIQYLKLRRVFRRLCGYKRGRGLHTNVLVFVSWREFVRLVDYMGVLCNSPP